MTRTDLSTKSAREAAGRAWAQSDERYDHFRVMSSTNYAIGPQYRTRAEAQSYADRIAANFRADGFVPPELYVRGVEC